MLTQKQLAVALNNETPDGNPVTPQQRYQSMRSVKVKIVEACEHMRLLYDNPEMRTFIDQNLSWYKASTEPAVKNGKTSPQSWPSAEELEQAEDVAPMVRVKPKK